MPEITIRITSHNVEGEAKFAHSEATNYLLRGGFFNPEMMDHHAVSRLVYNLRGLVAYALERGAFR